MEREVNKDIKLSPKPVRIGLLSDLALPQLEVHNFIPQMPEKEEEKRDATDEFRKIRTQIAQNRSKQKGLF